MMTPALFELLVERKRKADEQSYLRAGIVAAAVVNYSMCRAEGHKIMTPWDYVPGGNPYIEELDLTKMTPEDQARYIKGEFSKKIYKGR